MFGSIMTVGETPVSGARDSYGETATMRLQPRRRSQAMIGGQLFNRRPPKMREERQIAG